MTQLLPSLLTPVSPYIHLALGTAYSMPSGAMQRLSEDIIEGLWDELETVFLRRCQRHRLEACPEPVEGDTVFDGGCSMRQMARALRDALRTLRPAQDMAPQGRGLCQLSLETDSALCPYKGKGDWRIQ